MTVTHGLVCEGIGMNGSYTGFLSPEPPFHTVPTNTTISTQRLALVPALTINPVKPVVSD